MHFAALRSIAALVAPPLCVACARPCAAAAPICPACTARLASAPAGAALVGGVGRVVWAAPYEGVARELVAALKFGSRVGLAAVLAAAVADACVPRPGSPWEVVAVPPAPARLRRRGFDPADLIAAALAARLGIQRSRCLRRADGPRQVGRAREARRCEPPQVRAAGRVPRRALLVDDVLTTGATLGACARALRGGGAVEVEAAVFARAFG
jgi:ComF family protein